jgi:hypothetical protein
MLCLSLDHKCISTLDVSWRKTQLYSSNQGRTWTICESSECKSDSILPRLLSGYSWVNWLPQGLVPKQENEMSWNEEPESLKMFDQVNLWCCCQTQYLGLLSDHLHHLHHLTNSVSNWLHSNWVCFLLKKMLIVYAVPQPFIDIWPKHSQVGGGSHNP